MRGIASIAELARGESRSAKKFVALINSSNGGSSLRYNVFEPFGSDVVEALSYEDWAFIKLDSQDELLAMVEEVAQNIRDQGGLVECTILAFKDGEEVYSNEINIRG